MKTRGDAPYIWTSGYFQYGHVDVVLQTAPGVGVITSAVLYSDTLDEIDLEFSGNDCGANTPTFETNYFGKGVTGTYDRSTNVSPGFNTTTGFHTYTLDWTADSLTWSVDGIVVRTLLKANCDDDEHQYPQTPSQFHIGVWDGGDPSNAPGVIQWAGGQTNLDGFPYTAYVKSVNIVPASSCAYYNYTDTSGSGGSVECLSALPSSLVMASSKASSSTMAASLRSRLVNIGMLPFLIPPVTSFSFTKAVSSSTSETAPPFYITPVSKSSSAKVTSSISSEAAPPFYITPVSKSTPSSSPTEHTPTTHITSSPNEPQTSSASTLSHSSPIQSVSVSPSPVSSSLASSPSAPFPSVSTTTPAESIDVTTEVITAYTTVCPESTLGPDSPVSSSLSPFAKNTAISSLASGLALPSSPTSTFKPPMGRPEIPPSDQSTVTVTSGRKTVLVTDGSSTLTFVVPKVVTKTYAPGSTRGIVSSRATTAAVQDVPDEGSTAGSGSASTSVGYGTASPRYYNIHTNLPPLVVSSSLLSSIQSGKGSSTDAISPSSGVVPDASYSDTPGTQAIGTSYLSATDVQATHSLLPPHPPSFPPNDGSILPDGGDTRNEVGWGEPHSGTSDTQVSASFSAGPSTYRSAVTLTTIISLITPDGATTGVASVETDSPSISGSEVVVSYTSGDTLETDTASIVSTALVFSEAATPTEDATSVAIIPSAVATPIEATIVSSEVVTPVMPNTTPSIVSQPTFSGQKVQDGGGGSSDTGEQVQPSATGYYIPSSVGGNEAPPSGVGTGTGTGSYLVTGTGGGTGTLRTPAGPSTRMINLHVAGSGRGFESALLVVVMVACVVVGLLCFQ